MFHWRLTLQKLLSKWLKTPTKASGEVAQEKPELKKIWRESMHRLEAYDPDKKESFTGDAKPTREQVLEELANRQKAAKTATDLKSWWGQAVATWDPEDAKNIDMIEQKIQGPKSNKWHR